MDSFPKAIKTISIISEPQGKFKTELDAFSSCGLRKRGERSLPCASGPEGEGLLYLKNSCLVKLQTGPGYIEKTSWCWRPNTYAKYKLR